MEDDDGINMTLRSWANYEQPVAYATFPASEATIARNFVPAFTATFSYGPEPSARWVSDDERKARAAQRRARKKRRGW